MHVYVVKTNDNVLLCYHVSVSNTVTNPGSKRQEPVVTRALIDLFRRRLWRSRTTIPYTPVYKLLSESLQSSTSQSKML